MRARGFRPSALARSGDASSTAAAPSETCDDVPAVCTPPGSTGFSAASFSIEVSRRPSSRRRRASRRSACRRRRAPAPRSARPRGRSGPRFQAWIGQRLAAQAEAVGVLARDAVLPGDHLGALELRRVGVVLAVARRAAASRPSCWRRAARGSSSRRRRRAPGPRCRRRSGRRRATSPAGSSRTGCRRWSPPPPSAGPAPARRCGRC